MGAFFSPKCVEHEVNGQTRRFYAVPVQVMFELRQIAKPLLKAFTTLTQGIGQENTGRAQSRKTKTKNEAGTEQEVQEDINEVEGIAPQLAAVKLQERDKSIDSLVDAFLDPKNARAVARLVMASLRDEGFGRPPTDREVDEFLNGIDLKTAFEVIQGTAKANAEVFGPLAQSFQDKLSLRVLEGAASEPKPSEQTG